MTSYSRSQSSPFMGGGYAFYECASDNPTKVKIRRLIPANGGAAPSDTVEEVNLKHLAPVKPPPPLPDKAF